MNILLLSLGLFVIGLIEYTVDQYQKLLLSRLKLLSTVSFQLVNKLIEAVITLYVFGTIIIFWQKFQSGDHNFLLLLPYLLYTLGSVAGTGVALLIYKSKKIKTERETRMQRLEKANRIKKQLRDLRDDIVTEVETEMEFEEITEQEVKDARKEIPHKVESEREDTQKEKPESNPPQ
jgi:prepilin signal peptidase PulO-like enzyme (type II secretory pathway)